MNSRAKLVALLLLLVTFLVGALGGMAVEEALGIDWFEFLDEDADEAEDRVLVGLDLTREQRAEAEEILERQEGELEAYWESRLPEIRVIQERTYGELREILTPEQRAAFDRRVRELGGRVAEEVRD